MQHDPPLPTSQTSQSTSFAYTSARTRWPAIITSTIDDVHRTISNLPTTQGTDTSSQSTDTSVGKGILSELSALKYELQHNRALTEIKDDGEEDVKVFNEELHSRGQNGESPDGGEVKWHDVEWLFSECYLYRRISSLFKSTSSKFWREYDCFSRQKMDTFRSSTVCGVGVGCEVSEMLLPCYEKVGRSLRMMGMS